MADTKSFLGTGWKFPPTFDKYSASVQMVKAEEDIKESLFIILSTQQGERVMLSEFGCDIHQLVFEIVDATLITIIKDRIERAILLFEPRINVENIDVWQDNQELGLLHIDIQYTIRQTNTRSSMVYPFYLIEGTNVRFYSE